MRVKRKLWKRKAGHILKKVQINQIIVAGQSRMVPQTIPGKEVTFRTNKKMLSKFHQLAKLALDKRKMHKRRIKVI